LATLKDDGMTVDRQVVAGTISELRARLPEADDLLEGLQWRPLMR
jgi:hypothetical protein